ncbi:MAG: beta-galactosidase trimerization domain-containing protein [Spirochaetaceae bacterium]
MQELRFRQIHLDFHTSPLIKNIGEKFDADEFASTLKEAAVDSITCFARCHHGWLYYESKNFPELIHPELKKKGLLEAQIEACHKEDIRVPVYTTVQWDELQTKEHPEWLMRNPDGSPKQHGFYDAGFYNFLCVNTPYADFLEAHLRDMFDSIPNIDGIFLDIVQETQCSCEYCKAGMIKDGLKPHLESDRKIYGKKVITDFKYWMTDIIRSMNKDCSIFYNCQAVQQHSKDAYSHIEVESLPSGEWGYDHFAFESRYVRNLGLDVLGQTGKFHTAWGDFHSFKSKEALEYECFRMLTLNTKCMIGDQLEPNGRLSTDAYKLIGSVYNRIKGKEEWCSSASALCDTAVFDPREFYKPCDFKHPESLLGVMKMLEQMGNQFDIIDSSMDFSKYKLLILPDVIPVEGDFSEKIENYLNSGGSLILSYMSGFKPDKSTIGFDKMPVTKQIKQVVDLNGDEIHGKFELRRNSMANYIIPEGDIGVDLPNTEHTMYSKNLDVTPVKGSSVLVNAIAPEFYRDYMHFCSHRQAPSSGIIEGPAIVGNKNVIYYAHNIFKMYQLIAPGWVKTLFRNSVNMLLNPMLKHDGPSTLLTAINRQEDKKRDVLHLLHYIPKRVCKTMDIIEDVIPYHNLNLSIKTDKSIEKVTLVPEGIELNFITFEGRTNFEVEKLEGHQMVELTWKGI